MKELEEVVLSQEVQGRIEEEGEEAGIWGQDSREWKEVLGSFGEISSDLFLSLMERCC